MLKNSEHKEQCMTMDDPRKTLAAAPMSWFQIVAVVVIISLNALDGFDVLAISFASPGIAKEWGIDRAQLGIVLSMELIGMATGALLLGGVADRIGRRPTILGCLTLISLGMFMVTGVNALYALAAWRLLTGVGIGGMIAAMNAAVAEYANARNRDLCVSLMVIGYPTGAVLGGLVAAHLLKTQDWRSVFVFGGSVTAALIPIAWWRLPETVEFLCGRQTGDALARLNHTLRRMNVAPVDCLPQTTVAKSSRSMRDLFKPGWIDAALLLAIAFFLHMGTFYFVIKWVPKIVVDMGFPASSAAGVLVWANVGGATGGAVLGLLTRRFSVKGLTLAALLGSYLMVYIFGHGQADLRQLALICAITGFFTNSVVVGLYALIVDVFQTELRATATGFISGIGRGGAALSPIIAGFLFKAGYDLQSTATIMGSSSLLAAVAIFLLKARKAIGPAIESV